MTTAAYQPTDYEAAIQAWLQTVAGGPPAIYAEQAAPRFDGLHVLFQVTTHAPVGTDESVLGDEPVDEDDEESPYRGEQRTMFQGSFTFHTVGQGARALMDKIITAVWEPSQVELASTLGLTLDRAGAPFTTDGLQGATYSPTMTCELQYAWSQVTPLQLGSIERIRASSDLINTVEVP